jgi:UDP-N-acetylglucosamine 3-dehydrogenase
MSSKGFDSGVRFDAKRSLRVGVIGAGVMGTNHARVLAGLPDVTLVGIVDPLSAHRARATELTGCRSFASLDELLAEGIDAVTVAAPTHLHHEIALACIAREIHVLVEKPIASSVEEGRDIVDAARRAGVTLMVGHVERFNPAVGPNKTAKIFFRSRSPAWDRFRRECRTSVWSSTSPCTTSI